MKTLDEVIKAFEYTYENDPIAWTYGVDALHYLKEYKANQEEAYKRGYSCGYAKAKEDKAVSRSWDESYRASQMPWNYGCEMGG